MKAWQQVVDKKEITLTVQYLQDYIKNKKQVKIARNVESLILALHQIAAW